MFEILQWESKFTLGLNAAKNTHFIYIKNASNKNCSEFNLLQKSHWANMSIYLRSGGRDFKDCFVSNTGMGKL